MRGKFIDKIKFLDPNFYDFFLRAIATFTGKSIFLVNGAQDAIPGKSFLFSLTFVSAHFKPGQCCIVEELFGENLNVAVIHEKSS